MILADGHESLRPTFNTAQSNMHFSLPIRSLFVSDVHLGFRYSRAAELLKLLERCEPEYLYLVGDFLDGWRLKRKWYWPECYSRIVDRILQLAMTGTRVCYTPGNHDDFLRQPIPDFDPIEFADEFCHVAADGRVYYVTHGDLFDAVESNSKWLSSFGTRIYNVMMWSNSGLNRSLKKIKVRELNFAPMAKRMSKRCVRLLNRYQVNLLQHARAQRCDGVICGHSHLPRLAEISGVIYANPGDWVEHASSLIELSDGSIHLWDRGKRLATLPAQSDSEPTRASA